MHPLNFLPFLVASSMAATDVVSARLFSERNYKGKHVDVHGFGCSNVNTIGFQVKSVHRRKQTFCYAYSKINCKGSSIFFVLDVPNIDTDLTTHSIHCTDASN
ncbi:hypothetical protein BKA56DRAFT_574504 [Ilyonectria sp. MPI-CAGE-AT-0026]|nr:hypothetical protein BKA56DRAFT_574504 [Ilyonectria sp. MPI-CAGE-AT-0026]